MREGDEPGEYDVCNNNLQLVKESREARSRCNVPHSSPPGNERAKRKILSFMVMFVLSRRQEKSITSYKSFIGVLSTITSTTDWT